MQPGQDDVALLDAHLGHDLDGGRAFHEAHRRAAHRREEAGVGVSAQPVAAVVGHAVDHLDACGPGGPHHVGRAVDGARLAEGLGQLGQGGGVTDDAALHLGRDDRRVGGGDELGEVDGHRRR